MDTIFEAGPLVDHYHLLRCIFALLLAQRVSALPLRLMLDNVTYPLLLVRVVGFELTTLCSQSRCANQAALHSEKMERVGGVEPLS